MSSLNNDIRTATAVIVPVRGVTDDMRARARMLFARMASVFEEPCEPLSDGYLDSLLARDDFWAFAALADGEVIGGITAHVLPMTRQESRELFIYDLAVSGEHRRQGIGRRLIAALTSAAAGAGIRVAFVPVDNEDVDAIRFYRVVGGVPSEVTFFTFGEE